MDLPENVRKYFNYFFEIKGFAPDVRAKKTSPRANHAALLARGDSKGPAIFIQGIMPRSGTVYAGELLRIHPDLFAYPHQIWEFPALNLTDEVVKLQRTFLAGYRYNKDKFEENDFLPIFGSALLAFLHESVPADKRVLVKMPSVQYLDYFFTMFPYENLLVLLRDGRDLVHSTLRTWKQLNFIQVSLRWKRSAEIVLASARLFEGCERKGFLIAKYEDALMDPESFIRDACKAFGLDENRYPYEQIDQIRVIGSSKLENKGKVRWQHLEKPEGFLPLEYWKSWTPLRRVIFKAIAGKSLVELGYCQDFNW